MYGNRWRYRNRRPMYGQNFNFGVPFLLGFTTGAMLNPYYGPIYYY